MNNKITTEIFIKKSKEIHGNRYNYSSCVYINKKIKVKIICKEHGEFEQFPQNHLRGSGCLKCSGKNLTISEFINKSNISHKNKYDYSLVNSTKSFEKINIICPTHGVFETITSNHVKGSGGCVKCVINKKTSNNEEFINKSNIVHNNEYDYSLVNYINSKSKVKIICKEHGEFEQTPNMHLKGQGCPVCRHIKTSKKNKNSAHSFSLKSWNSQISQNPNSNPKLYILKCHNKIETFIKVGITFNDVKVRFYGKRMPYEYEVLNEVTNSSDYIFNLEKETHKNFKSKKYDPLLKFPGNGECYNMNELDNIVNYIINKKR
jgi:hypothetical protein